jgi:hypothetical protein
MIRAFLNEVEEILQFISYLLHFHRARQKSQQKEALISKWPSSVLTVSAVFVSICLYVYSKYLFFSLSDFPWLLLSSPH